ncbi:MAG: 1-acyl-sn-glycerol-3-phosphate acyltransferase [Puniceicoccales bacterium]|jgi:1-acyl-sn-glycerol-3-phosphate acyltransferase|nr:1-acyl-sn-glycerol-3-phosphate acyltransferase [Puniceicoccales bacterium]
MALTSDNPTYIIVYQTARWFANLFGRLDVSGLANVPPGASIIACNHQSFLDPPLVGSSLPRETFFFARKTLFRNPVLGWILRTCNTIPVDRDGGSDVAAFKRVFSILRGGRSLLMFPEGTRSRDGQLQEAQAGIGLIACKTRVPVVPVRVFGARDMLPRGSFFPRSGARLSVVFRPPIQPDAYDPGAKHPERFLEASRRIMREIAAAGAIPEALA